MKPNSSSFYDKLTSQTHIGLGGKVTYSTKPGLHGAILCQHGDSPVQKVMLITDKSGMIKLWNVTRKELRETFWHVGNVCAEQIHKTIEIFTHPSRFSP